MKRLDYPPVWLTGFAALAWLVNRVFPLTTFDPGALAMAGWLLVLASLAVMAWAAWTMMRARTTVIPRRGPDALVVSGPFRFSRNPIYLADAGLLAGYGLIAGSSAALLAVPVFMTAIGYRFIRSEEQVLRATFGSAFDDYCRGTRRWL